MIENFTNECSGKRDTGINSSIADFLAERCLGATAVSVMNDCYKYGMLHGCREDCPQLLRKECEIYKDAYDLLSGGEPQ